MSQLYSIAKEDGLDLAPVSAMSAKPVVCRVLDYGKTQYEKKQKKRQVKQKVRKTQLFFEDINYI